MKKLYNIREASEILWVHISTLRRWEEEGRLVPVRTAWGHRRYTPSMLWLQPKNDWKTVIAYARVSTRDQKQDLERQKKLLQSYCASKWYNFKLISDLWSGINYNKPWLKELIKLIIDWKVEKLVLAHKDRLLRFGAELVFYLCELKGCEVEIIDDTEQDKNFEVELAKDVLEILTVFSAKLYWKRSHKNQQLKEHFNSIKKIITDDIRTKNQA